MRGGPTGFWEIIQQQGVIGITLQQLTPELDGGNIIEKGFYNIHWSCVKNAKTVREQSVTILIKNIKKLQNGQFNPTKSYVYYNKLYKTPKLTVVIKYIFMFYFQLIKKILEKAKWKFLGIRFLCWTLFIGKSKFIESSLFRLEPIKLPKGVFYADPFLFKNNNKLYVFFENYSYKKKLAKISCGIIKNNKIIEIIDVLEKSYHLSYPQIFEEDGDIYLMPETSENKRLELYRCIDFPSKWELFSTAFESESISDTTYYRDETGQRWLFVNKGFGNFWNSELYLYKINSLKMETIEEHKQNPVIIDSRIARNAGPLFKYQNMIIRPSQNNSKGIYGYGLNLNEVLELNIDNYVEKRIISIKPNFSKGLVSVHHLHQLDNVFVIDGAYSSY